MDKIYRFNWNGKIFEIEYFEKAYRENEGIMFWRHPKKAKVKKDQNCLLYFGKGGSCAETKKLVGVVGIGKVLEEKEYFFQKKLLLGI